MISFPIKNMVCPRCIESVRNIATTLNLEPSEVALGRITLNEKPSKEQLDLFKSKLEARGFAIVDSSNAKIINRLKTLIIDRTHYSQSKDALNLSSYLSQKINYEYSHLSKLFSSVEGITIERYTTLQRIEKAKEHLSYDENSVSEISDALDYSNPAHFSAQFKRETGMTPTQFKKLSHPPRNSLDSI
ncbi:MAG: helix-turn-helix transcriptional regulator [Opitutaceae bacterium]|nr:helix-turn-helix transcriptional regulator [Opitutaceae bacterium]